MNEDRRIADVEQALRVACEKARAGGVALARQTFQLIVPCPWDKNEHVVLGCCALGAYDIFARRDLGLSDEEWDAVEMGWDGERDYAVGQRMLMQWYSLGARLATEFRPVPASSLEAT